MKKKRTFCYFCRKTIILPLLNAITPVTLSAILQPFAGGGGGGEEEEGGRD